MKKIADFLKSLFAQNVTHHYYYHNMTKEDAKRADKVFDKADEMFREMEKYFEENPQK